MADLPVFCNVLFTSEEEARRTPRGDIRLEVCHNCGFIANAAFNRRLVEYNAQYENSLHFSQAFQSYAKELAEELVERHNLRGKRIVEIACGKGDFLRLLCKLGENTGVGFDPGYVPESETLDSAVAILPEAYGEQQRGCKADFICCRHALEHLADPVAFLRVVRDNIGDHQRCAVFFEVPNVLFTLRDQGIWDILYEHSSYFWEGSLGRCFTEAGFAVESVRDAYEGQFLCIEARPARSSADSIFTTSVDLRALLQETVTFAKRFEEKLATWRDRLRKFAERGRRTVVWGSGSKGVTFLNMTKGAADIEYVVDINPRKQGTYVAGTGQQIVAPEFLREYKPNCVVVMNPIYWEEIHNMISALGIDAELLAA